MCREVKQVEKYCFNIFKICEMTCCARCQQVMLHCLLRDFFLKHAQLIYRIKNYVETQTIGRAQYTTYVGFAAWLSYNIEMRKKIYTFECNTNLMPHNSETNPSNKIILN